MILRLLLTLEGGKEESLRRKVILKKKIINTLLILKNFTGKIQS